MGAYVKRDRPQKGAKTTSAAPSGLPTPVRRTARRSADHQCLSLRCLRPPTSSERRNRLTKKKTRLSQCAELHGENRGKEGKKAVGDAAIRLDWRPSKNTLHFSVVGRETNTTAASSLGCSSPPAGGGEARERYVRGSIAAIAESYRAGLSTNAMVHILAVRRVSEISIKKLICSLKTNNIDGVRIATEVISVLTIDDDTKANNVKARAFAHSPHSSSRSRPPSHSWLPGIGTACQIDKLTVSEIERHQGFAARLSLSLFH